MPNRRAAVRLLTSVAVSLAVHAAVLLAPGGWVADRESGASRDVVLTVWIGSGRISPPAPVEPRPAAAKISRAEPPRRLSSLTPTPTPIPTTSSRPRVDRVPPVSPPVEPVAAFTPAESSGGGAPASASAVEREREWLRSRVAQELARYFTYPPLARQRGIEGQVVLAYRIEADGRVRDIAVAQSSGHGLLDRAALSDLGRVPLLTDAVSRLQGVAVEDTLAVIYRLRDN